MFKFNIFRRVKKPDQIKQRKDVFISIYENLQDAWMNTGELTSCSLKIDVSKFEEPTSEWVNIINRNLHFYNSVQYKIKASIRLEESFFDDIEMLYIELLDVPEVFDSSIEA